MRLDLPESMTARDPPYPGVMNVHPGRWSAGPLTEVLAQDLASWRYPAPYDCYDFPQWDVMCSQGWAVCNVRRRGLEFRACFLEDGRGSAFAAWFWLRPPEADGGVELGLGMRPDFCGHGLGASLMGLVKREAVERSPGTTRLLVRVRSFNMRATATYRRAGFTPDPSRPASAGSLWMGWAVPA